MKATERQFVICIHGEDDLEVGKVYQVLVDESAARDNYIRVVDECGEDYLYPADYFIPIALPREAELALLAASPSMTTA